MKRIPASIIVFLTAIAPAIAAETTDRQRSLPDTYPECMQVNGPDCVLGSQFVLPRPTVITPGGPTASTPGGPTVIAPGGPTAITPGGPTVIAPGGPTASTPASPPQGFTIISPRK